MDTFKKGWYSEVSPQWPGQSQSLEVEEVLYEGKSDFQHVFFAKTKTFGNMLALDGAIQVTERDEYSYQEMIAHVPMFSHPCPKEVLIIGGGDGGVLREVVKHPEVEHVYQCEIDKDVIELSKKYLPGLASEFDHPKATIHVGDGFKYMREHKASFDVIITDSSDPIGPASTLFEKEYYSLLKDALRPGGVVCSQGESFWLNLELVKSMHDFSHSLYPVVDYCWSSVPTYPCGQIGYFLCGLNPDTNFSSPLRTITQEQGEAMGLKYYNSEVHKAAFVLPEFARKALKN